MLMLRNFCWWLCRWTWIRMRRFPHACSDIISMLDKREYPWYAAWDLAFNTLTLSVVNLNFAKEQFLLMLPLCPSQWTDTGL